MRSGSCKTRVAIALLAVMGGLMWLPMHEESATADEAWILGAGYSYWKGYGFQLHVAQPPLAKMLSAAPLLLMDVNLSDGARALLEGRAGYLQSRPWVGLPADNQQLFPRGRDDWYYWWWLEGEKFGQLFVYDGANDAERLLLAGRMVPMLLSVLSGLVIFLWARKLAGTQAGWIAATMWAFNPVVLAYGHLVQTDAGFTLFALLSVWTFCRCLEQPTVRNALPAGGVFGAAVTTKFTAVGLLPIFAALGLIHWWMQPRRSGSARHALRLFFAFATTAWVVVLLVYAPNWAPPPPLDPEQAARIGVPWWFRVFRPVLIPRDFFKGVALLHSDVVMGHPSFFAGEWRATGWWYLLPAAVVLKTPIPLLLILAAGTGFFLWRVRHTTFAAAAPWVAAIVYFAVATMDRGNVATRHLLPVYALAAIGAAAQINAQRLAVRLLAWALCGWLALVAIRVHPFFIEYFNEFAGGPAKGYRYLVDSNYDWGQGVKRLRKFLDEKRIDHIYLKYFGVQKAIEYYRISNTRISPEEARRAKAGTLVISATALMLPEWRWLRESRLPVARVGWTLFVYALNDLPQQAAPEDPPARHEPTDNPG